MGKDYGNWTMVQLKSELRKRNAKSTGKKAVLVQRLVDFDKLFGPLLTEPDTVFKINLPEPNNFLDVTTSSTIPLLNMDDVKQFCHLTGREDITTSKNMYDDFFLLSCRSASHNNEFFITGMVCSEMRKNIIYNVAIKLKNHTVLEAQCECAAGMGPYAQCKHFLVLIIGIVNHNEKQEIKIKKTVTANLQTFHRPRRMYTGGPVKAEDLVLKANNSAFEQMVKFDPRPSLYQQGGDKFVEYFKQYVSNYICNKPKEIELPVTITFEFPDKKKIFQEHDYSKSTEEEKFIKTLQLNKQELKNLEIITRTDKKRWLQERSKHLQSSNFGKICKSKTNQKNLARLFLRTTEVSSPSIKHGLKFENEAVQEFEKATNIKTMKCGLIINQEHQYLACTPDRLTSDNKVLEIKCPYTAREQMISPETVPYLYLCEKSGELKLVKDHDYYYQVQGQMMVTGRESAYFCVYTIKHILIIEIERDNAFIQKMFDELKLFYEKFYKNAIIQRFLYNFKHVLDMDP